MKLTVELVPKTSWAKNVRTLVPKDTWNTIRKKCYRLAVNVCEICGGIGKRRPVECHEVWDYDDVELTQTLIGFISLCPLCHRVKHLYRTIHVGLGRSAFLHMANLNAWTIQEAGDYFVDFVVPQWEDRSKFPWRVDISYINRYIDEEILLGQSTN